VATCLGWVGGSTGATIWQARQVATGPGSTTIESVQGCPKKTQGKLTLNNHILTSIFVMLALTAGLGSQTITIMSEGLTALTVRIHIIN